MAEMVELEDVQGLVFRGYGKMPYANFLLIHINDAKGAKKWLSEISAEVTNAATSSKDIDSALNIAFTNKGVMALGLTEDVMLTFSREFEEGMVTDPRQRKLGDLGSNAPENWDWGSPENNQDVHIAFLIYAKTAALLNDLVSEQKAKILSNGMEVIKTLDTTLLPDRKEHFGFRDGVAQPVIKNAGRDERAQHASNLIKPGEFLFGYKNEYDEYTRSPSVSPERDPDNILAHDMNDPSQKDLGRNGSYLVFRQMEQDVSAFWKFIDKAVKEQEVDNTSKTPEHLAAKMVGRWLNGSPLVKCPVAPDDAYQDMDNFGYAKADFDGYKCPIGAHIRRTNPRDNFVRDSSGSLEKDMEKSQEYMKRFRILRRGRSYGKPFSPAMDPQEMISKEKDNEERGLHFLCFNSNIGRQFELIQQTWAMNPKVQGLYEDPDPIIGIPEVMNDSTTPVFTEPAKPLRKKITGIPQFVRIKGGAYFFMPGIRGLKFLAALP